jgi:glycosyltransferase involved in cell wall biosynthesis
MNLSVIIPVFNEVESLPLLHQAIHQALDPLGIAWEAVLVDDGSTDGSQEEMEELAKDETLVKQLQLQPGLIIPREILLFYRTLTCKTIPRTSL